MDFDNGFEKGNQLVLYRDGYRDENRNGYRDGNGNGAGGGSFGMPSVRRGDQDTNALMRRNPDAGSWLPQMYHAVDGRPRWSPSVILEVKTYGGTHKPRKALGIWQRIKGLAGD